MEPEPLSEYVAQVQNSYYNGYRFLASAQARFNNDFYLVESLTSLMSYPGSNQSRQFLSQDISDEQLGDAVLLALAQSRVMTYEFYLYRHRSLGRDEGLKNYNSQVESALKTYGYRDRKALEKFMRHVFVEQNVDSKEVVLQASERIASDGFRGRGQGLKLRINEASALNEVGSALRVAFRQCADLYKHRY